MHDIITILSKTEKLEESLSELYRWLSNTFSSDQEISDFFRHLSLDETSHRDIVRYQLRVARKDRHLFPDISADIGYVEDALQKIRDFRSNSLPSIESSLKFAVEMESNIAEKFFTSIMNQCNKEFATLVDNMSCACRGHLAKCIEMANKHNIQINESLLNS
jgi:rubrerythrin